MRNVRVRARDMNSRLATAVMFGTVRRAKPLPVAPAGVGDGVAVSVIRRVPMPMASREASRARRRGGGRPTAGGRRAR